MILTDAKLEALVHDAATDEGAWQVYADALLAAGDVRGEIISAGIRDRREEIPRLIEIHEDELWGPAKSVVAGLAFDEATWTGGWQGAKPQAIDVAFDYSLSRYGMVDTVQVEGLDEEGLTAKELGALLSCPLGRFVRLVKLTLGEVFFGPSGQPNYDAVLGAMTRARPLSLRCLEIEAGGYQLSWTNTGTLGPLLRVARNLEELTIVHGRIELGAEPVDLPKLRALHLESGGLPSSSVDVVATSSWPALERLTLFFGRKQYGGDAELRHLEGILRRPSAFPSLRHLALCNAEFAPDILAAVVDSPLLPKLATLDLGKGILSDDDVGPLLAHASAFAHLERLDLSESYLSPTMTETIVRHLPRAVVDDQRYEEMMRDRAQYGNPEWDTTGFRYTAVGE